MWPRILKRKTGGLADCAQKCLKSTPINHPPPPPLLPTTSAYFSVWTISEISKRVSAGSLLSNCEIKRFVWSFTWRKASWLRDVKPLYRKCESNCFDSNDLLPTGGIYFIMAATQILVSLLMSSVTLVRCEELRFLVVGDWGGESDWWPYTTPYETAVNNSGTTGHAIHRRSR